MFYKFEDKSLISSEYYKKVGDNAYLSNSGVVLNNEQIKEKYRIGNLVEVTETEFLLSVMNIIKTKKSLISDYESDINKLQFLFHVGYQK